MNIKERIKTIIEDYSFAKDEVNVRNNIKRTYKRGTHRGMVKTSGIM